MSNLSDLPPAGGGAKVAEFVASGTLASGQTVALKADGTVAAISATGGGEGVGSAVVFEAADAQYITSAFDSANNKVVVAYRDSGNNTYGTAVVGTVSGTSISFGTPVVFQTNTVQWPYVVFDSTNNKMVIGYYYYTGGANRGYAIVGTVSGTSISFGSPASIASSVPTYLSLTYDANAQRVVASYRDANNSDYGTAIVGTVSGTSISFGSAVVFASKNTPYVASTFDSNANKVVVAYQDATNSSYGTAIVGTVSGTSISFGSAAVFGSVNVEDIRVSFDTTVNKILIAYINSAAYHGTAVVGTVSGTSISFGSPVAFHAASTYNLGISYDPNTEKTVIAYKDQSNSNYGTLVNATISGTSVSFSSEFVFSAATTSYSAPVYDSNANKTVIAYADDGNSSYGTSVVYSLVSSNNTDFLGITNEAISNAATGEVAVQGGVATNPTGPYVLTAGSPNQFTSSTLSDPYTQVVYDSSNNKIVVLYRDSSNSSYGTAIVGTVSGASISFGSPVIFEAAQSILISATYDSNSNKVVVCYRDSGNSSYGTAIVGTVSGTSISFGTAAVFQSSSVSYVSSVQDSDTNKTIIAYRDNGGSNHGKSIVGTVSGTSISFGSATTFASSTVQHVSIGYDATNSRAVIAYETGTNGKAIVGTVSGTSISFGSAVTFLSGKEPQDPTTTFDPSSGKVLISYGYIASSAYQGTFGIVGTVSGTSISFGSEQYAFGAGYTQPYTDAVYDPDLNKIILVASTSENSYAGGSIVATISGTSVSFGAFKLFDSARTNYNSIAYDTTSNKPIIAYGADTTGGECVVGTVSNAVTLTPGTDYFVQDDGTLSTTSSSVAAGKAIGSTSLLLKG